MNNKKFLTVRSGFIIAILIIFAVVILGTIAYFLSPKFISFFIPINKNTSNPELSKQSSSVLTTKVNYSNNVTTYLNSKYKWEITIPLNWETKNENRIIYNPDNIPDYNPNEEDTTYYFFSPEANSNHKVVIDSSKNKAGEEFPEIVEGYNTIDKNSRIKIAGLPTLRTLPFNADNLDNIHYYFSHNKRNYTITISVPNRIYQKNLGISEDVSNKNYNESLATYEKILSTFKFVE